MSWYSLGEGRSLDPNDRTTRLDLAPLVLAGPILRKVTTRSVTVWIATKEACVVKLKVLDVATGEPPTAEKATIKLGTFLHMVAVTVRLPSDMSLDEGITYRYDMEFKRSSAPVPSLTLRVATDQALLYYSENYSLPSFCLPPADLTKLRIVHGSCRKPHGEGDLDALALLDGLIAESLNNPLLRPHQLMLTGDQIYADEVAAGLLTMVTDAARVLLGHGADRERMPLPKSTGLVPAPEVLPGSQRWAFESEMAPYQRNFALYASGFTSVAMQCHLMTLGEYLAMYLFVWSDVLWQVDAQSGLQLPSPESIISGMNARQESMPHPLDSSEKPLTRIDGRVDYHPRRGSAKKPSLTYAVMSAEERKSVEKDIRTHNQQLLSFHHTLKKVRRALAHVPSFMIFDDHEVTDDWNMLLSSTVKIHASPTGRRVVQNGLVAYALCQHWGNCPEQFEPDGDHTPPGLRLLQRLNGATGAEYGEESAQIAKLVGLPLATEIQNEKRMYHPALSLIYNYTIEGPAHQIVVADTRTWREYPGGETILMSEAQMQAQLRDAPAVPPLAGRLLMVVLTTNAPPVRSIRTVEQAPDFVNEHKHVPDLFESWVLGLDSADWLFKVLTDRLPRVNGRLSGGVVLLSGDVHHSFASEMQMSGRARRDEPVGQGQAVSAVFAQLVSSALRNEDENTRGLDRDGHDFRPGVKGRLLIPKDREEVFYGWNVAPGGLRDVATNKSVVFSTVNHEIPTELVETVTIKRSTTLGGVFQSKGSLVQLRGLIAPLIPPHKTFVVTVPEDWRYTLRYRGCPPAASAPPQPPRPLIGPINPHIAAAQYVQSLQGYTQVKRQGSRVKEVVGVNNISEITFGGPSTDRFVNHTIRWSEARSKFDAPLRLRFATIPVSLKPRAA